MSASHAHLCDAETGRIAVYYGCADTVTGLAFGYVPEIIDFIRRTNIIKQNLQKTY